MKRPIAVAVLLVFGCLPCAKAQESETPKIELCGGYDYVRSNANPRFNGVSCSESFGANGMSGQAVYNRSSRFGIVGERSGYRLTRTGRDPTYPIGSARYKPRI